MWVQKSYLSSEQRNWVCRWAGSSIILISGCPSIQVHVLLVLRMCNLGKAKWVWTCLSMNKMALNIEGEPLALADSVFGMDTGECPNCVREEAELVLKLFG